MPAKLLSLVLGDVSFQLALSIGVSFQLAIQASQATCLRPLPAVEASCAPGLRRWQILLHRLL